MRGYIVKKRLVVVMALAVVAALIPVAAAARPPAPPTLAPCVFAEDGTTLAYTGGAKDADLGYFCLWTPDPDIPRWLITVDPQERVSNIGIAVKYEHPGLACVRTIANGPNTAPVTALADMTDTGNCAAYPEDDAELVLWVDATVKKPNTVLVTVVPQV